VSFLTRVGIALVLCAAATTAASQRSVPDRRAADEAQNDVPSLLARGLYDQAETTAQQTVDRVRQATGAESIETARALDALVRASTLNGKASLPATIALAERVVRIKEARQQPIPDDLATSLINLGSALGEAAVHPRAIALLQRSVALRQREGGLALSRALDALGEEFVRSGRYEDALASLERSLSLKESAGDDAVSLTVTLNVLALALQQKADFPGARVALERASSLQKRDAVHPVYVTTLTLLGQQLWFEGSWVEARNASAQSVDLAERILRPDHPSTAVALRYLAATLLDLGDIAQAKPLQERALGIIERSLGRDHYLNAAALNALAESNVRLGDYPSARAQYEQALSIAENKLGPYHDWVATYVHNLALVDAHLGDYASARQRQTRAIAIWERAYGRNHQRVTFALMELAAVHREEGAPAQALPLLERALAIREQKLGPNHRDVAGTLADLSATLIDLGRPERAQALATRALRILDNVDAPDAPDLANVLELYAQLQARQGQSETARQYYERAITIKRRVFGSSHPTVAETQARLALTLAALGDVAPAFSIARTAESTGREHLRLMLRYLPERQSLNYAATRPRGLDLILSLTGSLPDATVIGLDEVIRSRALVLDEMAKRRNASLSAQADAGPVASELTRARQRLVNLVVRGPGDLSPARYTALVDEARRDSERLERTLTERNASFNSELKKTQIGFEEVQKSLPTGSALVSFIRYQRTGTSGISGSTAPGTSAATTSYLAFVMKPHETPVAIPLGPVRTIDALVAKWRADISNDVVAAKTSGSIGSSRVTGDELRKRVWDPIAAYLKETTEVFIVPDGTLSLVPFAALPVQQSGYLIEHGPVIHYVSAERDLASFTAAPPRPAQKLLAIGGPAFDDQTLFGSTRQAASSASSSNGPSGSRRSATECEGFQQMTFSKLDGSLREVQEVARLWNAPAPNGARVLVGRDASERTFKEEASHYSVLHVATHGFFLSNDGCERARPGTRGTRAVGGLTTAATAKANTLIRENPLLLAGLALAGANRRSAARPDDDDGILMAEEVASLNLGNVAWAVLSACDTGLGEIKAGEGVFGLRRAFQIAGAHTVIMSLWSVDDQATRAWMRALYEGRFQKGLDTAHAVNAASLAMLRERRARGQSTLPFYWAAFVAAGDWR
jgi:CHAT domain-containing protein/tetratricopeptide (TPR) repeat protein